MDINKQLRDVCNPLFRDRKYQEAKQYYQDVYDYLGDKSDGDNKNRLICLARIMDCIWELNRTTKNTKPQAVQEHNGLFDKYLTILHETAKEEIAPDVVLDVFGQHLHMMLADQEIHQTTSDAWQTKITACFQKVIDNCKGKVRPDEMHAKWFTVIEEVSREVERGNLLDAVTMLASGLIHILDNDPAYNQLRCAVYKQLANTALFYPKETDQNKTLTVVEGHLEKALENVADDIYAKNMRHNVRLIKSTNLQIRGFLHDVNSHIAIMDNWLKTLADATNDQCRQDAIKMLEASIDTMQSLAIIANSKSVSAADGKLLVIKDLLQEIVLYHGLPEATIEENGHSVEWLVWPGHIRVALNNLIQNSRDAYDRRKINLPDCLFKLTIEYDERLVYYRDFAGGIKLAGDIFEPYMSEKGVHTDRGLGLAQARTAMRAQQYDLYLADEQPESGACFVLDFNRK